MKIPNTLKTFLKDCKNKNRIELQFCKECNTNHSFSEELLKKEAQKWIQYIKCKDGRSKFNKYETDVLIWWINLFFGLEEK